MMELYLRNIMWFCLILLLIAATVAVIEIVIILLDLRSATREAKKMVKDVEKKVKSVTSILDLAVMLTGGLEEAKKRVMKKAIPTRSALAGFFAGLKKGLEVLLNPGHSGKGEG